MPRRGRAVSSQLVVIDSLIVEAPPARGVGNVEFFEPAVRKAPKSSSAPSRKRPTCQLYPPRIPPVKPRVFNRWTDVASKRAVKSANALATVIELLLVPQSPPALNPAYQPVQ